MKQTARSIYSSYGIWNLVHAPRGTRRWWERCKWNEIKQNKQRIHTNKSTASDTYKQIFCRTDHGTEWFCISIQFFLLACCVFIVSLYCATFCAHYAVHCRSANPLQLKYKNANDSSMRRWQFCFQAISLEINFDENCFSPDANGGIDANALTGNKTVNEHWRRERRHSRCHKTKGSWGMCHLLRF